MKKILMSAMMVAVLASCGNSATKESDSAAAMQNETEAISLVGSWDIENVVVNDTLELNPAEITPDSKQAITFEADGSYSINTNCNSIQGQYVVNGDSIRLEAGLATEMACDNMQIEDAIKAALPAIAVMQADNDSTVSLNAPSTGASIRLRRAK